MAGRKLGRHTKRTPALTKALCNILRQGGTRTAALAHVGVDFSTFYLWLDRYPEFSGAVTRAEADAELRFLRPVRIAAGTGDWRAAAFWLERRRPADWAERQQVEQQVTIDIGQLMREHLVRPPDPPPALPPPEDAQVIDLDIQPNGHTNGTITEE